MLLTDHFSVAEFIKSDTAVRMGIDNTPSAQAMENLKRTAELAEDIRAALNENSAFEVIMTVSSGYRSEALEQVLCAKDFEGYCDRHQLAENDASWQRYFNTKAHPRGMALDFRADRFGTPFHIVRFLQGRGDIMAEVDQLILEGATQKGEGWVHVNWAPMPRHQVRTALFNHDGRPHYVNGLT